MRLHWYQGEWFWRIWFTTRSIDNAGRVPIEGAGGIPRPTIGKKKAKRLAASQAASAKNARRWAQGPNAAAFEQQSTSITQDSLKRLAAAADAKNRLLQNQHRLQQDQYNLQRDQLIFNIFQSNPNSDEAKLYYARMSARYNHDAPAGHANEAPLDPAEGNLVASLVNDEDNDTQVETAAEEEKEDTP